MRRYGASGLTTTLGNLNTEKESDARREEATGHLPKSPDTDIDEEPPASFRKPGDLFTVRRTPKDEGHCMFFLSFYHTLSAIVK